MRGLLIPDREEDFTADPVELFFDLAFVFAFSQLVYRLVHHPTWGGAAEAGLLFAIIWLAWSLFTWQANALSGNGRPIRTIFLIATAMTVPMAASVRSAFDSGGLTFAVSGAVIMSMSVVTSIVTFDRGTEQFAAVAKFSWPVVLSIVTLVVGGATEGNLRIGLWVFTVVVILGSTMAAGASDWIVRSGHFAERHGLILIVALGEVVVAIGITVVNGLDGEGLTTSTRLGLLAAGTLAALLWWAYFDRVMPALEHHSESIEGRARSRFVRDAYTWFHAPIVGGVITAAAAAEEALLHPSDPLHLEFRIMLAAGLALYLGGIAIAVFRSFRVVAYERLIGIGVLFVVCLVFSTWPAVWLLIAIDVILTGMLLAEHRRIEGRSEQPAAAKVES